MAITEFKTIVESGDILFSQSHQPWKVWLYLCDGSLLDVYYSTQGKYSYHWDKRLTANTVYRHDNAPHQRWKDLPTFPKHFHNGTEDLVISSYISDDPELALKEFLQFAVKHIVKDHLH